MFIHLTSSQFLWSCSLGFSSCTKFKHGQCKISHVTFFTRRSKKSPPIIILDLPFFIVFDLTGHSILVLFDLISLPSIILISMQCLPLFSTLFADKQQRLSPLQRLQGAIFFPKLSPEGLLKSKLSPLQRLQRAIFSRLFSGKFIQIKAIAITGSISSSTFLGKLTQTKRRWRVWMCAKKPDRKQAIAWGQKRGKNLWTFLWLRARWMFANLRCWQTSG